MINYAIPGAFELFLLNDKLLNLFNNEREIFYDNVNIEITYGNPQFCIWDGGRIFSQYKQLSKEKIQNIIDIYNTKHNIPIRYVFTNAILKEENYNDRYCNLLMSLGSNFNNEVVLADDSFKNFLKDKYSNYKFVSSTTKCITNKKEVLAELEKEDYKLVCLDYNLNHNISFLEKLSPQQKEKVELLINPICPLGCKYRKEHYYLNSMYHLNYGQKYHMVFCGINFDNDKNRILTYDYLTEIYEPLGITHFKIEGRTWNEKQMAFTYCDYMIRPEFKKYFMQSVLE